jgi:hypothetical protein
MAHGLQEFSIHAELKQFMHNPAPRRLSPSLRKHFSKSAGVWTVMIFGGFFAAFGSFFCVMFVPWKWLHEYALDKAPPRFVEGCVSRVEKTNMSVNEASVWKYEARFVDGAQEMTSVGYTTGRSFSEGEEVFVRVHPQKPELHCPQGMRMSRPPLGSSFVLLFPLVGFSLMFAPWIARKRRLDLYENGAIAEIEVIAVKETNMTVNDRRVYQFSVKFPHLPQIVEVKKTSYEDASLLQRAYVTKEKLHVFYDPKKPKRFVTVDQAM